MPCTPEFFSISLLLSYLQPLNAVAKVVFVFSYNKTAKLA